MTYIPASGNTDEENILAATLTRQAKMQITDTEYNSLTADEKELFESGSPSIGVGEA